MKIVGLGALALVAVTSETGVAEAGPIRVVTADNTVACKKSSDLYAVSRGAEIPIGCLILDKGFQFEEMNRDAGDAIPVERGGPLQIFRFVRGKLFEKGDESRVAGSEIVYFNVLPGASEIVMKSPGYPAEPGCIDLTEQFARKEAAPAGNQIVRYELSYRCDPKLRRTVGAQTRLPQ